MNESITVLDNGKAIVRVRMGNKSEEERKACYEKATVKLAQHIKKHNPDLFDQLIARQ